MLFVMNMTRAFEQGYAADCQAARKPAASKDISCGDQPAVFHAALFLALRTAAPITANVLDSRIIWREQRLRIDVDILPTALVHTCLCC
jgi:hypothetical protein